MSRPIFDRHVFVIQKPSPCEKKLWALYNARKKAERSCLDMDAIYSRPRFKHLRRQR